jgi:hypothetical protein
MKTHLAEILSAALGVAVMGTPAHAKAPPGRFVVGNDSTSGENAFPVVFDTKTKLTWQQGFFGPPQLGDLPPFPPEACLHLDEQTDSTGWRVPTLKELLTLVDFTALFHPAGDFSAFIDATAFPGTPAASFVSSTSSPSVPLQCVDFAGASLGCLPPFNYIRCVR